MLRVLSPIECIETFDLIADNLDDTRFTATNIRKPNSAYPAVYYYSVLAENEGGLSVTNFVEVPALPDSAVITQLDYVANRTRINWDRPDIGGEITGYRIFRDGFTQLADITNATIFYDK